MSTVVGMPKPVTMTVEVFETRRFRGTDVSPYHSSFRGTIMRDGKVVNVGPNLPSRELAANDGEKRLAAMYNF